MKNSFTQSEKKQIELLLIEKCKSDRVRQKSIRNTLRKSFDFRISDFTNQTEGYGVDDFREDIRNGRIFIVDNPVNKEIPHKIKENSENTLNINAVLERIEKARLKYKPKFIKLLLVAEAPPNALDRFFYNERVEGGDFLYKAVVRALCKDECIENEKLCRHKTDILEVLKDNGVFLMDLSQLPVSVVGFAESQKKDFLEKLSSDSSIDRDKTYIVLIKVNVYDCLYATLKSEGYRVQNKRIPFPSSGQQLNFKKMMDEVLESICIEDWFDVEKLKSLLSI